MTQLLDGAAWGIFDAAMLVAEVDRDLAERSAQYPEQVRKGRMGKQEAEWLTGLLADIREDLLFAFAPLGPGEIKLTCERLNPRVTWSDKVRWINRELELRRDRLPDLVAKGRLTANELQRRISMIELLRRLYWNKLFQWQPPEGPASEYLKALRASVHAGGTVAALHASEGARVYRELVRRHMAAVDLEDSPQGELAA